MYTVCMKWKYCTYNGYQSAILIELTFCRLCKVKIIALKSCVKLWKNCIYSLWNIFFCQHYKTSPSQPLCTEWNLQKAGAIILNVPPTNYFQLDFITLLPLFFVFALGTKKIQLQNTLSASALYNYRKLWLLNI